MSEFRIASRYAKSLLELAQEKNKLEDVMKDMKMFEELCVANRDFVLMLKKPIISHGDKLKILKKIFTGKVDDLTMSIFEIIVRKSREKFLPEIAKVFRQQYNVVKGIVESTVTTVIPISAEVRKDIKAVLAKLTNNSTIVLNEIIDPELIGGFVLKVGDKQIDGSVSSKLRELSLQFSDKNYVSKI